MTIIGWLIRELDRASEWLTAWQRAREDRAWLLAMKREWPVGCAVRPRHPRCEGRVWYVHSHDADSRDVRLVGDRDYADGHIDTFFNASRHGFGSTYCAVLDLVREA